MPRTAGERKQSISYGVVCAVASLVFAAEYVIKGYLRTHLAFQSIPIIENVFHITVTFNTGAAFGILKGKTTFLIYITVLFILIFFVFMKKEKKKGLLFLVAGGMLLGGAFSNLWDRIFLGHVVDYLDFRIWPVFNLADASMNIGVGLLLLDSWRNHRVAEKN